MTNIIGAHLLWKREYSVGNILRSKDWEEFQAELYALHLGLTTNQIYILHYQ